MSSSPSAHRRVARFIFFLQCAGGGGHRWPTPTEFLSSDRRRFCVGQMQQKFGQMCLIVNFFEFFNRCMYVSVYLGHYASCIFFCCGTTKLATAQVMLHLRGHYGDLATSFLLRQSVCTRESFWPGQFSEFSFVFFVNSDQHRSCMGQVRQKVDHMQPAKTLVSWESVTCDQSNLYCKHCTWVVQCLQYKFRGLVKSCSTYK